MTTDELWDIGPLGKRENIPPVSVKCPVQCVLVTFITPRKNRIWVEKVIPS